MAKICGCFEVSGLGEIPQTVCCFLLVSFSDNTDWIDLIRFNRSSRLQMFCRKGVLIHFAKLLRKYLSRSLSLIKLQPVGLQLYYKETLMQTFSCEFCDIFKNTYFVGCSGFNKHIIHGMQYILTLYYDFIQFSQQQQKKKKHVRMCLSKFAY